MAAQRNGSPSAQPPVTDTNALRSQMQADAVQAVMEDYYVIVEWGTGVGKSRVAIGSVRSLRKQGKTNILLLVAETAHKTNWRNEFIASLGNEGQQLFDSLTVECYASLNKYCDTWWDLIIADEAHHLRSDNRTSFLVTMHSERVLCLSATLNERGDGDMLMQTLQSTFGYFRRIRYTLTDAIESGILAQPRIYVHVIPKDGLRDMLDVSVEWGFKNARRKLKCMAEQFKDIYFDPHRIQAASLTVTGTFPQLYDIITSVVDDLATQCDTLYEQMTETGSPNERIRLAKKRSFLETMRKQYGMRRKRLLGQAKTRFADWLLRRLENENKRYVCFCSDVNQGEELGGDNIISARRNPKENAAVIEAFNNKKSDSIFAVSMIQEGQNLAGIQAGVIVQLGGKEREFIQKFGRAMRSDTPEQHIIVINDTRDVYYYKQCVDGIDPQYIHLIRYKQKSQQAPASAADRQ